MRQADDQAGPDNAERPPLTRAQKIDYMLNDLTRRGIWKSTAWPPLYRVLSRCGLDVTPPLFDSFWSIAISMGVYFAFAWGCLMWLLMWRNQPWEILFVAATAAGILFGLSMAAYFRWRSRRLGLPRWQDYPTPQT